MGDQGIGALTDLAGLQHRCDSVEETEALAGRLADALPAGSLVALNGDLGTGKTVFARALCRAWGVPESVPITSPTFAVVNTYMGRFEVHHFDVYRLSDTDELEAVGCRDFVVPEAMAIVEWAERVKSALPAQHIEVSIRDGDSVHQRLITILYRGVESQEAAER